MDSNKIGLTILGATVIGLVFLNHKLNRTIEVQGQVLEVMDTMVDMDFQKDVDEKFAEIVENFED